MQSLEEIEPSFQRLQLPQIHAPPVISLYRSSSLLGTECLNRYDQAKYIGAHTCRIRVVDSTPICLWFGPWFGLQVG